MKTKILTVAVACMMAFFTSCDKNDTAIPTNPNTGASGNKGAMTVKMTDAPADYAAMNVEITKVEVQSSGGSWVELNNQSQQVSVLSLNNGLETTLASNTSMDVGVYTKVRLTFGGNNKITLNAGTNGSSAETTLDMSYPGTHEVVIDAATQVNAGSSSTIVLDFNAAKSVAEVAGQYVLNPVISHVNDVRTGIRGRFNGAVHAVVIIEGQGYHFATYTNATANFLVRGMKPGVYKVTVWPTPMQVAEGGLPQQYSVQNVVVANGSIKDMGTINL